MKTSSTQEFKLALDKITIKINVTPASNKFKLSSANVRTSSQYLSEEVGFLTKRPSNKQLLGIDQLITITHLSISISFFSIIFLKQASLSFLKMSFLKKYFFIKNIISRKSRRCWVNMCTIFIINHNQQWAFIAVCNRCAQYVQHIKHVAKWCSQSCTIHNPKLCLISFKVTIM